MNQELEKDLQKTAKMLSSNWKMQNNYYDKSSNFIYEVVSLDECLAEANKRNVNKDYALHRWYNYMTSIQCEKIFCEYGAVPEEDKYNHDVDIYIDETPFDVKLTVYPKKLSSKPYDLKTRTGKNSMIRWYYENQSQQNRKQLLNRLYVVCDAPDSSNNLIMKSNFDLMRKRISAFMEYVKTNGFNEITITDCRKDYKLISDIVRLDE